MDEAAIFQPHLKPGERIVWSASASADLRRAEQSRVRAQAALWAVISGALAVFCGYRFYEAAFLGQGQSNLSAAVAAPLFVAFGAALAIFSVFMFRKLGIAPPPEQHYAATDLRLLAVDGEGKLVDEIAGADIAGAVFDDDRRPTELHIGRRDSEDRMFFIEHLPDLAAVKARIHQTFPEAPL